MSINLDSVAATVERYMIAQCEITRVTGEVYNEVTMEVSKTKELVYTGKCFISPMGDPQGTRYGPEDVYRIQFELALPRSSPATMPNDQVEIFSSPDPRSVADDYFVHDEIPSTFLTHRRIKVFRDRAAT